MPHVHLDGCGQLQRPASLWRCLQDLCAQDKPTRATQSWVLEKPQGPAYKPICPMHSLSLLKPPGSVAASTGVIAIHGLFEVGYG